MSCGAWLALNLWEQSLHAFDPDFVVNVLLPVYRNIAQFFLDYMFQGAVYCRSLRITLIDS